MINARFGHIFDKPLTSLAKSLNVNPNVITVTGFFITCVAALTLPYSLRLGGLLIIVGGFFDMFDGIAARVNQRTTAFGAFLDSLLDRYSDSFLFIGFAAYFHRINSLTGVLISLGAMIGAVLVSYARARAEALGKDCHTGLMERPERIILLAFGALTGWILFIMWIMVILTHMTVIQRVHYVWKAMK